MSQNDPRCSYVWSVIVIACLLTVVGVLARCELSQLARTTGGESSRRAPSTHGRPSTIGTRRSFAMEMNRRFAQAGRSARTRVVGGRGDVFEVYWPGSRSDQKHAAQLKRSKPLFEGLKEQGFGKMRLWQGGRVVWGREL